jgi:subtilase family serine protease
MAPSKRLFIQLAAIGVLFSFPHAPSAASATKPDLKVTELTAERVSTMSVPLRIEINLHIKNVGAGTGATQFVTRLSYRRQTNAAWQVLYDWNSGAVAANGGAAYSRTFDFTEGGTYYFKAEVDANSNVAESSEGNNTKTLTESFQAGTPDLTISNLVASELSATASGSKRVKVDWDVQNIGDGKASGSFVTVLYLSKNTGPYNEVQRYTRSNLEKNNSLHFSHTATYTDFNSLRFRVMTDEAHAIQERQEGNNTVHSNSITK